MPVLLVITVSANRPLKSSEIIETNKAKATVDRKSIASVQLHSLP